MNSNIGAVLGEQEVVGHCLPRNVFSGGMSPSPAITGNGCNDIFANAGGGGEQPLDAARGPVVLRPPVPQMGKNYWRNQKAKAWAQVCSALLAFVLYPP